MIIMQTTKCITRSNNFKTTFTNLLICKFFIKQCFTQIINNINKMLTYYKSIKTKININGDIKAYIKTISKIN